MRRNTGRDTGPELALRSLLHRRGWRFRKDYPVQIDGQRVRPDVVFTKARLAVFVDGCFWHACPIHGTKPRVNQAYWGPKLARNAARDREEDVALTAAGWRVLRIWEHEDVLDAAARIEELIGRDAPRKHLACGGGPVSLHHGAAEPAAP